MFYALGLIIVWTCSLFSNFVNAYYYDYSLDSIPGLDPMNQWELEWQLEQNQKNLEREFENKLKNLEYNLQYEMETQRTTPSMPCSPEYMQGYPEMLQNMGLSPDTMMRMINRMRAECIPYTPQTPVSPKTNDQVCQDRYGTNVNWGGVKDANGNLGCSCKAGYIWNKNRSKCVTPTNLTPINLCQETRGINSYPDGTGGCLCKDGYIYDVITVQCVKEVSTTEKTDYTDSSACPDNAQPTPSGSGCECIPNYIWDSTARLKCIPKPSNNETTCNEGYVYDGGRCQSAFEVDANKSQFRNSILQLKDKGVVNGYSDGTFKPFDQINRAEFIKIVIGAKFEGDTILEQCTDGGFSDVPNDAWYKNYACVAKGFGIVDGYSDGSFKPEQPINVAEALKITLKAFGIQTREANSEEAWYAPFTEYAQSNDYYLGTFNSDDKQLTREDMAELVYRMMPSE